MAKFSSELNRTSSLTLPVGSVTVDGTTARRFKIYDLMFGSEATPQDSIFLWKAFAITAAGTSTGVTPAPLDRSDTVACLTDSGENHTIDATPSGGAVLSVPLNQRATFRWVAAPGGELVAPATTNNGFAFYTPTSSALIAVTATVHFEEQ